MKKERLQVSINLRVILTKQYKLLTNLMLLTMSTNFLKWCELVKRVLYLGTKGVWFSIYIVHITGFNGTFGTFYLHKKRMSISTLFNLKHMLVRHHDESREFLFNCIARCWLLLLYMLLCIKLCFKMIMLDFIFDFFL